MASRNYFIILNPVAGDGRYRDKLLRIKQEFNQRKIPFSVFDTNHQTGATDVVRDNFDDRIYSDLLILGGDGTINETLNGLKHKDIPISVISLGTGNDTIKHIHKKYDFESQLNIVFDGNLIPVDAGTCNGRIFLNGVGIGFDGKVVEIMEQEGKSCKGHLSYLSVVLRILLTYSEKPIIAEIGGKIFRENILLMTIAKGKSFGGGFLINPFAQNDDGLLDICLFKKTPLWMRVLYLPKMKNGGHRKLSVVEFHKATQVKIDFNPDLVAHMDGEFIGHPPFDISILPGAFLFRT